MNHETGRPEPKKRWWLIVVAVIFVGAALIWVVTRMADGTERVGPPPPVSSSQGGETADGGVLAGQSTSPTPTSSPGADEVVPAPGETAPIEKPPASTEVPFDEKETVAGKLLVEAVSVDGVTAGRDIPGEVSGPAVKVVIRVHNEGSEAVDTSGASVNLTYGDDDRIPAVELTDPASSTLPVSLAAGASADAVYIFAVPLEDAGNVRIMVDVLASEPDVVFAGPRP